jgi:25S rRNA (adenine2142-N1)-methyltransferase
MATAKKSHKRQKLLSSTRPRSSQGFASSSTQRLSSKTTRTLIRSHHTLQKQLSAALSAGNVGLAESLRSEIDAQGGLAKYQQASIFGQSSERGGDSSRVLMQWIEELRLGGKESSIRAADRDDDKMKAPKLRLLEVGSLSTDNACARSGLFAMTRIDLHSQHADILEQDFMQRPIPLAKDRDVEAFDLVSLSLVVNYVGDAAGRGDMLRRVADFLRHSGGPREQRLVGTWEQTMLPGLFLVLPAPCVQNSRYLTEEQLELVMQGLGYVLVRKKISNKLVYYLWQLEDVCRGRQFTVSKKELRTGKDRNNFAIVLRCTSPKPDRDSPIDGPQFVQHDDCIAKDIRKTTLVRPPL